MNEEIDKSKAISILNQIMDLELAGVVRYTHYALMVYGYNRIPIVGWLNAQADASLLHARLAGELITSLGGHPSLGIGPLLETHQHDVLPSDVFVLCSDGLSDMLDYAAIAQVLLAHDSLESCTRALIDAANDAGGKDNISVILARASGGTAASSRSWWPFRR